MKTQQKINEKLEVVNSAMHKQKIHCVAWFSKENKKIVIDFFNITEFQCLVQSAHTFNLKHGKKYKHDTLINFLNDESICNIKLYIRDDGYLDEDKDEYFTGKNVTYDVKVSFDKKYIGKYIKYWNQMF